MAAPTPPLERLAAATTLLFVPADRPDRFARALGAGADGVVVDLQDAVRPERRRDARSSVAGLAARRTTDQLVVVRISELDSPDLVDDVRAARQARADAVMVPAFAPAAAAELGAALDSEVAGLAVIGLIETPAGLLQLLAGESLPSTVDRLALGAVDLHAQLGLPWAPAGPHADAAAVALVWASAAAGLPAPLDSPHIVLDDPAGLTAAAERAARFGFGGKLAIHPDQIGPIRLAFAPSAEDIAWAHEAVSEWSAAGGAGAEGALRVRGQLVDAAMLRRARRILTGADQPSRRAGGQS